MRLVLTLTISNYSYNKVFLAQILIFLIFFLAIDRYYLYKDIVCYNRKLLNNYIICLIIIFSKYIYSKYIYIKEIFDI